MGDDPVPTPPSVGQGLPERSTPYAMVPADYQLLRCSPIEGQGPIIAMVYDSPDARVVSYWTEAALLNWSDQIRRFLGAPMLTLADANDLRVLKDTRPFEKP